MYLHNVVRIGKSEKEVATVPQTLGHVHQRAVHLGEGLKAVVEAELATHDVHR
jgi:hypothetical protein